MLLTRRRQQTTSPSIVCSLHSEHYQTPLSCLPGSPDVLCCARVRAEARMPCSSSSSIGRVMSPPDICNMRGAWSLRLTPRLFYSCLTHVFTVHLITSGSSPYSRTQLCHPCPATLHNQDTHSLSLSLFTHPIYFPTSADGEYSLECLFRYYLIHSATMSALAAAASVAFL